MKKTKVVKKSKKSNEPIITDIAREYFTKDGVLMVKIQKLNGKKLVSEEVIRDEDDKIE